MDTSEIAAQLTESHLAGPLPLLIDVAADLHAHPEIRFTEVHAAARLTTELEAAGFSVQRGYAGLDTAFIGAWSTPDADETTPTAGIFCEFDALEGIGHACGHNLIAASCLGASLLTKAWLEANPGTKAHLKVIGSPGEEGAAGKVPMIDAGVLDGVDFAVLIHPTGGNAAGGTSLSRVALDVDFTGRASHAAAAPEGGINALDAATLSLTAIGMLRQQLTDDVRVHAIITDGGQAPNIIPEHTAIRCFVRAHERDHLLENVVPRVRACFEGAALATGCTVGIAENTPPYFALISNPVLVQIADEAFTAVGRTTNDAQGLGAGSTDMGNVSQVVPAIQPTIELVAGLSPHTREFATAAGDPETAVPVIEDGAVILASTVLRVLTEPQLLADIKDAFERR